MDRDFLETVNDSLLQQMVIETTRDTIMLDLVVTDNPEAILDCKVEAITVLYGQS